MCIHTPMNAASGLQTFHLSHQLLDVFCQQLWFFKSSKMPPTWHVSVSDYILELLLCPSAWCVYKLLRKDSKAGGDIHSNPKQIQVSY